MVRAPCCEKMGLKKGPWTPEEDEILINYIKLYGHGNWRALPKQAGLLRCGKSCRLRWTNYLRPDIKRGNFTPEEEDTIIKLHEMLGNKWSAIAAKLPGRTDNEIKNVWHTHLKKKLKPNNSAAGGGTIKKGRASTCNMGDNIVKKEQEPVNHLANRPRPECPISSPQRSTSDMSSVTNDNYDNNNNSGNDNNHNSNGGSIRVKDESFESSAGVDDDFWSEVLSANNSSIISDDLPGLTDDVRVQLPLSSSIGFMEHVEDGVPIMPDNIDLFWFDVLTRAGELTDVPEFE